MLKGSQPVVRLKLRLTIRSSLRKSSEGRDYLLAGSIERHGRTGREEEGRGVGKRGGKGRGLGKEGKDRARGESERFEWRGLCFFIPSVGVIFCLNGRRVLRRYKSSSSEILEVENVREGEGRWKEMRVVVDVRSVLANPSTVLKSRSFVH